MHKDPSDHVSLPAAQVLDLRKTVRERPLAAVQGYIDQACFKPIRLLFRQHGENLIAMSASYFARRHFDALRQPDKNWILYHGQMLQHAAGT